MLGLAAFSGGSSPATLTGSLSGFASHEGITYRLDDSTSGTTLARVARGGRRQRQRDRLDHAPAADGRLALDLRGRRRRSLSLAGERRDPRRHDPSDQLGERCRRRMACERRRRRPLCHRRRGRLRGRHDHVQVDGGSSQTITGTSGNVTIPAPTDGSNDGLHTIAFYATDDAGNVEAPAQTATVKIDATKPSTTLATTPAEPGRVERLVPAVERAVHPWRLRRPLRAWRRASTPSTEAQPRPTRAR